MPVVNIIDRRTNRHDVRCDVVLEPAGHENSRQGPTKFPQAETAPSILERDNTTFSAVLEEFAASPHAWMAYLYDPGSRPVCRADEGSTDLDERLRSLNGLEIVRIPDRPVPILDGMRWFNTATRTLMIREGGQWRIDHEMMAIVRVIEIAQQTKIPPRIDLLPGLNSPKARG